MDYENKFKEELKDRIRYAEVVVESTQRVYTTKEIVDFINDPIKRAEAKFTFNLGVLQGLKEAKELFEEIEDALQR